MLPAPLPHETPLHSTFPVPFETRFILMFASDPVAERETVAGLAVAAFVIVMLSTADAVAEDFRNGFPLISNRFEDRSDVSLRPPVKSPSVPLPTQSSSTEHRDSPVS